jgi:hypothetical protein
LHTTGGVVVARHHRILDGQKCPYARQSIKELIHDAENISIVAQVAVTAVHYSSNFSGNPARAEPTATAYTEREPDVHPDCSMFMTNADTFLLYEKSVVVQKA